MRLPGGYLSYVGLLMDVLAVAAFDPRESGRIIGLLERGLASLEAAHPEEVKDYYEAVYSVEMAKDDGDEGAAHRDLAGYAVPPAPSRSRVTIGTSSPGRSGSRRTICSECR